ncbi:MAG: DNA-directed RNA polymerase subunit alpha [Patescibacteria group bacterium]
MERIPLPSTIRFEAGAEKGIGKLVVEPLYPGFGTTVGNALHRILLSSLPSAAVIAIRIAGAPHEFTALPKVQEDLLQIIMNVKQLRLKLFNDEVVKVELHAKGQKQVTAGDITANSSIEIANPELVLATLTSKDAALDMELWVQQGRGYDIGDSYGDALPREAGIITVDAFYSPVRRVSFTVERARVGQMTNFDKLVMTIETDNTISGEEAVKASAKILVDHFAHIGALGITGSDEVAEIATPEEAVPVVKKRAKKDA